MPTTPPDQTPCQTVCPADIHRAMIKALARHAVEQASQLDIGAFGDEVVVVGDVASSEDKQVLLQAARRVPGVARVKCLIRVREA
jgi:osmotically-inducible protein OsmY